MTIADCITAVRVRFEKWDHVPDQKKKEKRLDDVYILVEIIKILSGKKNVKFECLLKQSWSVFLEGIFLYFCF